MYSTYGGRTRQSSIIHPADGRWVVERLAGEESTIAFPRQEEYVVPARSRTASMLGGDTASRKLLRTLSTVSIYESGEGLPGGLAEIAPIGRYIVERDEALPSEMPHELDSQSPPQPQPQPQSGEEQKDGGQKEAFEGARRDKARFHIQE